VSFVYYLIFLKIFTSCELSPFLFRPTQTRQDIPCGLSTNKDTIQILVFWNISIYLQGTHISVKLIVDLLVNKLSDFSGPQNSSGPQQSLGSFYILLHLFLGL